MRDGRRREVADYKAVKRKDARKGGGGEERNRRHHRVGGRVEV